ncbi:MAG: hypothetical protein ABJB98_07565 [Actinomycetota bacterium]
MTHEVETMLAAALDATATAAVPDDRRVPPFIGVGAGEPAVRGRRPWASPLLAAAAVAVVAVGAAVTVAAVRAERQSPAGTSLPSPLPGVSSQHVPSGSGSAPTSRPTSQAPSGAPHSAAPQSPFDLGFQPLWPFRDLQEATAWRVAHQSTGVQPWHSDAGQTALSFTQGYLGLRAIDTVTSTSIDQDGAHIGVGYRDPNGGLRTSAVLHLVRFGPQSDAPWEVVGSDDTSFSLEHPDYGSTVTSPITVGGHITGVDESITVTVRQIANPAPLGRTCCTPAGGVNSPWTVSVSFSGATDDVLTVLATTGGHLMAVERFTIQGVRTRS